MLELYRRHSDECKQALFEKNLPLDAFREYTACDCPIWMVGTKADGTILPRQSLRTRDWAVAEAIQRKTDADASNEVHGPTLENCTTRYSDSRKNEMGRKSYNQYQLLFRWLNDYCRKRGLKFAQDLTVDLLEDFKTYGIPEMKSTSKAMYVSKLRAFLKTADLRGWTKEPLSLKVTPYAAASEQKQPYSAKEVEMILAEAGKLNGGTFGFATLAATFVLLLRLMLETGMRVSDAVRYDPTNCQKGSFLWIYTFTPRKQKKNKTPESAEVFLSEELKTAIDNAKWYSARFPFAYRPLAKDNDTDYLAQAVYERMQEIGKRIGIEDCRPHRLRDTFAVRKLTEGMQIGDVSRLLYHRSVAVTEKYYAPWNKSRKSRLEQVMYASITRP